MEHVPLANEDQRAAEEEVRAMLDMPVVRGTSAQAKRLWRLTYGGDMPAGARPSFDAAMDEYVAKHLFKGNAGDKQGSSAAHRQFLSVAVGAPGPASRTIGEAGPILT